MPKGFKRKKNAGVGVDFKRAKLKVGKKLPQAQNATDTNVVARTINLPNQSITVDKTGAVVTQRNLTLKDLLGQCSHYSERVRLDALRGLTELLQAAPEEGRRHAAAVVATVSERAADPDAACRAAQRDLLQRAVLPALGTDGLQPFVPVLMGHVTAAMTHMADPIRRDALRLLGVVMERRGDLVADLYLTQVLQHFSDALARPSRGGSIKAGSLAALQSVLSGLRTFLEKATKQQGGASPAAAPATPSQQQTAVLAWQRGRWNAPSFTSVALTLPLYTEAAVDDSNTNESAAASLESSPEGRAARRVLELLVDAWVECCPAELTARPELGPAKAAATVLQCCNLMLGRWGPELAGPLMAPPHGGGGKSGGIAATLVDRIAAYFPVPAPAVAPAAGVREELMAVNVAAAKLLVTFMPQAIAAQHGQQQHSALQHRQHAPAVWVAALLDWLQGVMSTAAVLPTAEDDVTGVASGGVAAARGAAEQASERKEGQPQKGKKKRREQGRGGDGVPAAVYGAALSAVADCLALLPQPRRLELLAAAWALWERSPVKSTPRAKALDFFAALVASPALPGAASFIPSEEAARWAAAMPKFMWELGAHTHQHTHQPSNPPVAAPSDAAFSTAFSLLLNAARFAPAYSTGNGAGADPMRDALGGMAPQLTPLFGFLRAAEPKSGSGRKQSAGSGGTAAQIFVVGPLAAVAPSTQQLAVDLVCHLPGIHPSILQTAALIALGAGAYPLGLCLRLIEVAASKAAEADSGAFWGALLSLISGRSQAGVEREAAKSAEGWVRHEAVAGAGVRAALSAVGPEAAEQAVAALGPGLLRIWQAAAAANAENADREGGDCSEAARPLYGLLILYRAAAQAAGTGEGAAAAASSFGAECGEVQGALPAAAAAFVRACAASEFAMTAEAAAKLVVAVIAIAPAELLPAVLAAATPPDQKKLCSFACLQACLVLLVEIAKSPELESALVEQAGAKAAEAAAEAVGQQVKAGAAQEKYKELQPLHQQALALMSQKLGKDLS